MDLSKIYSTHKVWDSYLQKHIVRGHYNFKNTKNFSLAVKSITGYDEGSEYAFIYEKYRGGPCVNIIIADPNNKKQILHKRWTYTYIRSMEEDVFNDIVNFIKPQCKIK